MLFGTIELLEEDRMAYPTMYFRGSTEMKTGMCIGYSNTSVFLVDFRHLDVTILSCV
jgi:hypothetical protein